MGREGGVASEARVAPVRLLRARVRVGVRAGVRVRVGVRVRARVRGRARAGWGEG
jgi:hypothetical protein